MALTRLSVAGTAVAAAFSLTSVAQAAEYYIAPATDSPPGNDSNAGSESAPWASLANLSRARSAGDVVFFKAGGSWTTSSAVRMSSGVNFKAYGSGARPLIVSTSGGAISLSGNSTLDGLHFQGTSGNGIMISGSNNLVQNCEVDDAAQKGLGMGIGVMGTGNKILGNYVHDLSLSVSGGSMNTSGGAEGIMVMASNNEIAFNTVINCQGPNSTLGGFEGGCYEIVNGAAKSTISNVSFHHNYCERSVGLFEACSGNFTGQDAIADPANHGKITDVIVAYNISVDAMWMYLLQPVNTDFTNVVFANNTIIHTANSAVYWDSGGGHFMMALSVTTDSTYPDYTAPANFAAGQVIVRNNIFVDEISSSRNFMFGHNVADHSNNLFVPSNANVGSLTLNAATEKKVNLADLAFTSDYRLTASSTPAIDQGTTANYAEDIDHHTVPCGAAPDIGASEYCEGSGGTTSAIGSPTGGSSASTGGGAPAAAGANPGDSSASSGGASSTNAQTGETAEGAALPPLSSSEGGCGCRVAGDFPSSRQGGWPWIAWVLGLLLYRRRAKASGCQRASFHRTDTFLP